jgi:hypothetical protein
MTATEPVKTSVIICAYCATAGHASNVCVARLSDEAEARAEQNRAVG